MCVYVCVCGAAIKGGAPRERWSSGIRERRSVKLDHSRTEMEKQITMLEFRKKKSQKNNA